MKGLVGYFSVLSLVLASCVPQGETPRVLMKVAPLVLSPVLEGDFGSINQLQNLDRIFAFEKSIEEEQSEPSTVSLVDNEDSAFSIVSKTGCEKSLVKAEKCLVRVRASGRQIKDQAAGIKTASLQVGSVVVPLTMSFSKLEGVALESSLNDNPLQENTDIDCSSGRCVLILKYFNPALIPQEVSSLTVPAGFMVLSNSCSSAIAPGKQCYVRLLINPDIDDLFSGSISLNVGGETQNATVRVIKENDTSAPTFSPEILDAHEYDDGIYVLGNEVHLRLTLADNRDLSKGLKYVVSTESSCSGTLVSTTTSVNDVTHELHPAQNNTLYVKVQDAVGNSSACLPLEIKNLALKSFGVTFNQPTGSGLEVSSSSVLYGQQFTFTYTPPNGRELVSWSGDCAGTVGLQCVISSVSQNKNVSIVTQCKSGYSEMGELCILNVYGLTLTQPLRGTLTASGSLLVDHGDSRTITFTPNTGYVLSSWTGDCTGIGSGNSCVLSNITSSKTVSVTTTCATGYTDVAGVCQAIDSCKNLLAYKPQYQNQNGLYQLVNVTDGSLFNAYCDMTSEGGGWTLLFSPDSTTAYTENQGYDKNHVIYKGEDTRAIAKTAFGASTTLAEQQKSVKNVKFTQLRFFGHGVTSAENSSFATKFINRTAWNFTTAIPGLLTCTSSGLNKWDMLSDGSYTQQQAVLFCYKSTGNGDAQGLALGGYSARRTSYSCGRDGQGGGNGAGDTAGMAYYCARWYLISSPSHRGGSVPSDPNNKDHMVWGR